MTEQPSGAPASAQSMAYEEAAAAVLPASSAAVEAPIHDPIAADAGCHSSEFGYNGAGSTHGMIGIGATTDTGSSHFKPDGDTEIDPHPTS